MAASAPDPIAGRTPLPAPDLRARRHELTRRDLVDAAFDLFGERGFTQVTMDEIAQRAGVSRSTAYRRFETKEDIVLAVPDRWLEAYDAVVDGLDAAVSLEDAFCAGGLAVARHIDAHIDVVRAAYAVLADVPGLDSSGVVNARWLSRFARLAVRHGGVDDATATVLAGAFLGAIDSMMYRWASTGGTTSVVAAVEHTNDVLRPLLRAHSS
ncbi:MAG: TetR/AcrR family transcriptional regulator [Actinomycetota bacterium]